MLQAEIIRAWKDPKYRKRMSAAELASLPGSPAGGIEIKDADLNGSGTNVATTYATCTCTTATRDITCPD